MRRATCAFSLIAIALVCIPLAHSPAADPKPTRSVSEGLRESALDLFDAIASEKIDAKLVLKDETAGRLVVTNKTAQPLTIQLPEAFAGVPVLAQLNFPNNFPNNNNNNRNNNNTNQSVGGGVNQYGNNGGFLSIEPEKAVKIKVVAVCLEHGKREPNQYVAYEILPLEKYTSDRALSEVIRSLGRGDLDQKSTQAAAWHLANGLTWKQLAAKIGVRHIGGRTEPFFTSAQLERALAATKEAARRAEQPASASASGGE